MANQPTTAFIASPALPAKQVYAMAAIYLVIGLGIGYIFRASQATVAPGQPGIAASAIAGSPEKQSRTGMGSQPGAAQANPHAGPVGARMPDMSDMKQMADKKAAPLLDQLKRDPNNSAVLAKVAAVYFATHQFKEAAGYYGKSLQADPKNVGVRTMLAVTLDSDGDVDGALAQLNQALTYDPKDANSLFDQGMIRLQGKKDPKGAIAAWQQLLKSNPQLSADRRTEVQKLIAQVQESLKAQHGAPQHGAAQQGTAQQGTEGAPGNAGHKSNSN